MFSGAALGWAGVDDQINELAALCGERVGGLRAEPLVLVGGDRLLGEDLNDDAGRGCVRGRTMQ